ncbi:MAG TPA: hypothetical protein VN646_23840 [Candidatus Acidoferrum sp.]|nr:hypothetical protein [Candidatus Acidoferrum sp.]
MGDLTLADCACLDIMPQAIEGVNEAEAGAVACPLAPPSEA